MQCVIVSGNETERESYIDSFIRDNHIKPYNILTFTEKVKIADARSIKKFLSTKQNTNEKKLVLLSSVATLDSQNALLKTLEEMQPNTYFIWSLPQADAIILTIQSRCNIVSYRISPSEDTQEYERLIDDLLSQKTESGKLTALFRISDEVSVSDSHCELFICALRNMLLALTKLEKRNKENLTRLSTLLTLLQEYYPLMKSNNLNKKIVLENLLIASLGSDM